MTEAVEPAYVFKPDEQPLLPGSPYAPAHPMWRRIAYAAVGVVLGISASLGNALITVNLNNLSGALHAYAIQASWLPAIYVAMNASANLMLIKARIQYGIPAVTYPLIAIYALTAFIQLLLPSFPMAIMVRAVNGLASAGMTTMIIYYFFQALPAKMRPAALVIAISSTLTPAIARMVPVEMLALDSWRGLHLIELGLALSALAAFTALPLPPSQCSKAFERLDFVTFALLFTGISLISAVLGIGRLAWWTDTPWLGWALAAAVPLFGLVILLEYHRDTPLLHFEWIGTGIILRFAAVAVLVRLALAEQTYGAVGLLTSGGLTNDQLRFLFALVLLAMLAGIAASILTLGPQRTRAQVMLAALFIAAGAWMDSHASNITRPEQLYLSQVLIAFGSTLFIGPALVHGFLQMLQRGPAFFVSFVVLFSVTQNVGGLAGSALLGSLQTYYMREHTASLAERALTIDPQVVARIQGGTGAIAGVVVDPGLRGAQGAGLLGQAITREATVLAYNDVFHFVFLMALGTALFLLYLIVFYAVRKLRTGKEAPV